MNNKGFTLVELLAVIIILAVLVVITAPIVLNFIDKAEENKIISSSRFYIEAVDLAISLHTLDDIEIKDGIYIILDNGNICLEYEDGVCKDILMIDAKGNKPVSGSVTITNEKVTNSALRYDEETLVVDGRINPKVCSLTLDEDKDGIADIGDMITCSTESFHVISNDGETISMLAQYNLDVGQIYNDDTNEYEEIENPTGIQNENAIGCTLNSSEYYGVIAFSTIYYWYDFDNDTYTVDANYASEGRNYPFIYGDYKDTNGNQQNIIYPYIKSYEEYLIKEGVTSTSATLISYEQLIDLGCAGDNQDCTSSQYDWTYSTSYWTGSDRFISVWEVNSNGNFNYDDYIRDRDYGVRPVVNISVNELK